MSNQLSQKGEILYLAIVTIVILLALAFGLQAILISQLKTIRGMENSVLAFFAADTGIERALYEKKNVSGVLENGTQYEVQFIPSGGQCNAINHCIKSVGTFKETKRAIETTQ